MKSNYKRLGDYIRPVNLRNVDLKATNLLGINIDKFFMPSVANVVGTDMSTYKVVKNGQFACNRMHVGRDYRLPVALSRSEEVFTVSPAYDVFEIKDSQTLLPEYLMMWFSRNEFDRNAWFYTDADVRGGLDWEALCDMTLPIPLPDKQRELVAEYNTILNRINLNNQLIRKLEETAQAIYKQWFVDFEFPNENGEPYKSAGGEMQLNKELEVELPKGWEVKALEELCDVKGGKRLPKGELLNRSKQGNPYIKAADMHKTKYIVLTDDFEYVDFHTQKKISRYIVSKNDVILAIVGFTIGQVNIIHQSLDKANLTENCAKLTNIKVVNSDYLYHFLMSPIGQRLLEIQTVGGAQGKLPLYNIQSIQVVVPEAQILEKYLSISGGINEIQQVKTTENSKLTVIRDLLFSKLATVED